MEIIEMEIISASSYFFSNFLLRYFFHWKSCPGAMYRRNVRETTVVFL